MAQSRQRSRVAAAALLLFAIAGGSASAQRASTTAETNPPTSAEAFAATIDQHYNRLHSLSVHFTQRYDGMGLHRVESGTLLLKRRARLAPGAGQMRWTYTQPAGKLFILDGRDAYFYTPGQTEIPRVPAKKLDDLRSPLAFLLGHASLAKQLDRLRLERGGISPGPSRWMLLGVPRGFEKRIGSMTIAAKEDGTITMLRVEETDGASNTFTLADEQPNPPAPASAFVFTPPPGTHVIEGMPPL